MPCIIWQTPGPRSQPPQGAPPGPGLPLFQAGSTLEHGGRRALTPVGNFYFGHVGDITWGNATLKTGWKQTVFDFGLGITFH